MALIQTRAKQIRIRLVDPQLTALEKYAKITGTSLDDYIIGAALDYPLVIAAMQQKEQDHEPDQDVPTGPEAA